MFYLLKHLFSSIDKYSCMLEFQNNTTLPSLELVLPPNVKDNHVPRVKLKVCGSAISSDTFESTARW